MYTCLYSLCMCTCACVYVCVFVQQAVVAMQLLAEQGLEAEKQGLEGQKRSRCSLMSESLIDQGCHELLFQILERFDDTEGEQHRVQVCLDLFSTSCTALLAAVS